MIELKNKTIVVWFSCGAASAVASKLTIEKYGKDNKVIIVNNPVDEEDEDNMRFFRDCENWFNQKIVFATNPKLDHSSAVKVWEKSKFMSSPKGAPCTKQLKKEARYEYEKQHEIDYHVLGFTIDEKHRHERFIKFERENVIPVLIDQGLTKGRCFEIIQEAGIKLPRVYNHLPNANCIGCVKSSSVTYWQQVRKYYPDVFKARSEQSRRIGTRLVKYKGKRIFLDELPEDATGGKIKNLECGIFCDTE